jgi:hypothetical protein
MKTKTGKTKTSKLKAEATLSPSIVRKMSKSMSVLAEDDDVVRKTIMDLTPATTFGPDNVIITRNTTATKDERASYAVLSAGLGNSAVNGFVVDTSAANQIQLKPSNNGTVDKYYSGMKISFVSPIASTAIVQIGISGLPSKSLFQYGTGTTASVLAINDYVEAVYIGSETTGNWFQTNTPAASVYTNDYTAVGTISQDEASTTYALTTAAGLKKTAYYNAMSAIFTTDIASKGSILLNIDNLGLKQLNDPDGDNIPFSLAEDQAIMAIYNGTSFIKRLFSSVDQPAPPYIPDEPIPDENKVTINVGPTRNIKTITAAINQLINDFGPTGGNRICTIELDSDFIWTELVIVKGNLSWITVNASSTIPVIPTSAGISVLTSLLVLQESVCFKLKGTYSMVLRPFVGLNPNVFTVGNGTINWDSFNFVISNPNNVDTTGNDGSYVLTSSTGKITLTNCNLTSYNTCLRFNGAVANLINVNINGLGRNGANGLLYIYYNSIVTVDNLKINDARQYNTAIHFGVNDSTVYINNCTYTLGTGNRWLVINQNSKAICTNNFINNIGNEYSVYAMSGSKVTLSGGDYRSTITTSTNIAAQGTQTLIILTNGVLVGQTSTSQGGQIVNE